MKNKSNMNILLLVLCYKSENMFTIHVKYIVYMNRKLKLERKFDTQQKKSDFGLKKA